MRRSIWVSLVVLCLGALCAGAAATSRAQASQAVSPDLRMETFAGDDAVTGSGGERSLLIPGSIDLARLAYAVTHGVSLQDITSRLLPAGAWAPFGSPVESAWASRLVQTDSAPALVSDGQFVWGPNAADFDVEAYLEDRGSDLAAFSDDIIVWSDYSSVNPQVLLAVLQVRDGLVDGSLAGMTADDVRGRIEDTAIALAKAFYEHLYLWGSRRPADVQPPAGEPAIELGEGTVAQVSALTSSGSYAVASVLAVQNDLSSWQEQIAPQTSDGFVTTFAELFPGVDPLDESNAIDPPPTPPADLLQFPFPLGAVWYFNGPHSWNGDNTPPFSSMDFYAGGGTCSAPPYLFSVAAASGSTIHPSHYSCWIEVDHGGGWTTSYYHLINTHQGTSILRNGRMGTIDCQTCAGGYATGPHVHFSLKYNGSYVSLDGTRLSGWKIKVGNQAYYSGSIQRDGVTLPPFSQVVNDYETYYSNGHHSLRFYANGTGDIDRVKIPVQVTGVEDPSPPIDVGWQDFTIEWWMKVKPGDDPAPAITCGPNINWIHGNTIFDRDRFNQDRKFGISLAGGRIVFGVSGDGTGDLTLCGTTPIDDGQWHHIAVERNRWDGVLPDGYLWIFIDGKLDASGPGPRGNISYPDNATPGNFCGPSGTDPCINDPYLVIGAEKHGLNPTVYPSYKGWIDEIRVSNTLRYTADFTPPTSPFTPDSFTLAIYTFDEGAGDSVFDTSGYPGGPSDGLRMLGGTPAGPKWANNIAPIIYPTATPTWTPGPSPTATLTPTLGPSPTPSATSSATPTPTLTATPSASSTSSPTRTPTVTATATPSATASASPSATVSATPSATLPGATPTSTGTPAPEDINQDGRVDVLDVQLCVNVFLGTQTDPAIIARSDVNHDGMVNVLDVQAIVNTYLSG
jgi:hypothetical protein